MGRSRTAASAHNGGSGGGQRLSGGGKACRVKIKDSLVTFKTGESRIGFGNKRNTGIRFETGNDLSHSFRSDGAVASEGIGTQRLKADQSTHRITSGKGPA